MAAESSQHESRREFIQKLGQFRKTLPQDQQKMLDAMVIVAEGAHNQNEVTPYGWIYGSGDPANPKYYDGTLAPGQTSPWWETYNQPWMG
jgi:hypothetical protein